MTLIIKLFRIEKGDLQSLNVNSRRISRSSIRIIRTEICLGAIPKAANDVPKTELDEQLSYAYLCLSTLCFNFVMNGKF